VSLYEWLGEPLVGLRSGTVRKPFLRESMGRDSLKDQKGASAVGRAFNEVKADPLRPVKAGKPVFPPPIVPRIWGCGKRFCLHLWFGATCAGSNVELKALELEVTLKRKASLGVGSHGEGVC